MPPAILTDAARPSWRLPACARGCSQQATLSARPAASAPAQSARAAFSSPSPFRTADRRRRTGTAALPSDGAGTSDSGSGNGDSSGYGYGASHSGKSAKGKQVGVHAAEASQLCKQRRATWALPFRETRLRLPIHQNTTLLQFWQGASLTAGTRRQSTWTRRRLAPTRRPATRTTTTTTTRRGFGK